MRRAFAKTIVELAEQDERIVLIIGDFGYGIISEFKDRFPQRFYNFGICEQATISVAAGMALEGLRPYVYTITPFLIERPFEQLKLDIDQQHAPVTLVGYADYPEQGPTHSELDAQYMMKMFKNIDSYFPINAASTREAFYAAHKKGRPAFISLKKDA